MENSAKNIVDLLHKKLSYEVQGAAFEVRKDFGLAEEKKPRTKQFLASISFLLVLISGLFLGSSRAQAAVLFSQAANQDTYEGQSFVVDWYLDTENQSVNVLDLGLKFSPQTLEVVETSAGNSLLNLWVKNPVADNQNGTIKLTGGITSGIKDSKVPIFHTVFRAKTAGAAFINLDPASQILLNDGRGTTTQLKFKNENFNIYPKDFIPVKISSTTHPDSNAWYANHDVSINFETKPEYQYSYSFSSNIELVPDNLPMSVPAEISYPSRPDGIYYFKLNSKKATDNWQEAGVYRVQIDSTPPEEFAPEIGTDSSMFDAKPFVSFSTVDKTSGISHYKVKLGAFNTQDSASSPVVLPKIMIGKTIEVTAYDTAGNTRTEKINYPQGISPWFLYGGLLILAILVFFVVKFFNRRDEKK
jgi:hypothetical protein